MIKKYTKNIERKFLSANNEQLLEGIFWYEDAREFCIKVSKDLGVPLFKVVGVVSALSPSNNWERNKVDAINFIKLGMEAKCCTYNAGKIKALKIMHSSNIEEVLSILNGNKTKNFFINIYYVECDSVTIDRWALRVANHHRTLTDKVYRELSEAHKIVAAKHGFQPKHVQAVTWIVERGGHD